MDNPVFVQRLVTAVTTIGIAASVVGAVDGIVLMFKRKLIDCPDGTYFPEGTSNFSCYAHHRMAEGIAILTTSLALGGLLLIAAVMSAVMLKTREAPGTATPV